VGDVGEFVSVIGVSVDRFREVLTDLRIDHVEGCHELDVADVIAAQVDVHQTRNAVIFLGIPIKVHPLD
jgi:hypothetical protein